ncbi:MAG: diacylglycerol kinase family lipid kinase [Bacteroidales bacterium]|nr:diacylglycerol kinase family lipid kinase [Bacteroidales bacterium]
MKLLLFYNDFAGNGRAKRQKDKALHLLKNAGHDITLIATQGGDKTSRIVSETSFEAYDGVFAAGGDGTLMEVANGYIQNPAKKKPPLGILPIGTGNAFIRDLGYKTGQLKEVIENLDVSNTKWVDAGIAQNGSAPFYFFNIIGVGFTSDVTVTALKFKWLGNFAYTIGIFYRALNLKTEPTLLEVDGKKYELDTLFVEVSNTRYTSNFLMAPAANFDDGLLDVTILKKMNTFQLIKSFPKILTGEHIHLHEVMSIQGKDIKISTKRSKAVSPDGELKGHTPITIGVKPKAIEFFA